MDENITAVVTTPPVYNDPYGAVVMDTANQVLAIQERIMKIAGLEQETATAPSSCLDAVVGWLYTVVDHHNSKLDFGKIIVGNKDDPAAQRIIDAVARKQQTA